MRKAAQQARTAAKTARKLTHERKARFEAAHAKGMEALANHDYQALSEAIQEEREVIDEVLLTADDALRRSTTRRS